MEINLADIWHNMSLPVKSVVLVLTLQAVGCVAVTIDRLVMLATSQRRSRDFASKANRLIEEGKYDQALDVASKTKGSHLASFMYTGLKTFLDRRSEGHRRDKAAELTKRALERRGESVSNELHRGMNVLASTGSTAPFVGLLGTVLGIINAFKLIAASDSGGIGTIGSAIGEALIVTGYGLTVAIPAVLLFNWLSGKLAKYEGGLVNAGSELVDQLETSTVVRETSCPGSEHAPGEDEPSSGVAASAA